MNLEAGGKAKVFLGEYKPMASSKLMRVRYFASFANRVGILMIEV